MAGTVLIAIVTNSGKERHAQGLITGKAFRIRYFELGSQGHDPLDPLVATTPSPGDTEVAGRVFGPEDIDGTGFLSPTCPTFNCVVERTEAVGALVSSIGLIAEIISNGIDTVNEIGTTFLYAIAHMPQRGKTSSDRFVFDVGVQV
jgi:hypothetical protein